MDTRFLLEYYLFPVAVQATVRLPLCCPLLIGSLKWELGGAFLLVLVLCCLEFLIQTCLYLIDCCCR